MTPDLDHSAIGIVGAGPVAQAIGRLLFTKGEPVVVLASRSPSSAAAAATFIDGGAGRVRPVPLDHLAASVSRVLIATADAGISPSANVLARTGFRGVALHTCGAMGPEALSALRLSSTACGVLHPLQTVIGAEEGVACLPGVTFAVAGDPAAVEWGRHIAEKLGGRVLLVPENRMSQYHAAAVMASNALAAVIDAAVQLMARAGIDEATALEAIAPLSRASLANALELGPARALTGPIARGDVETVRAHVRALAGAPEAVAGLYRSVGKCLVELARRRGMAAERLRELALALDVSEAGEDHGR